jgi:hypothetical protein
MQKIFRFECSARFFVAFSQISTGLSDLPFLYSMMVKLADSGPGSHFEAIRRPISHLKAAIGCLVEVPSQFQSSITVP